MNSNEPAFPYFMEVAPRDLTSDEREVVMKLLESALQNTQLVVS